MASQLIIVESPGKIKTIQKYLGPTYEVASCYGHVRDLPKKEFGIDIPHGFKPTYLVDSGKKSLIAALQKQAKKASCVWLASDDDREGEAIAWHLKEVLDLPETKVRRIVFRALTKSEIEGFERRGRGIDQNLVKAQETRRILDRIVGYELSPLLWKKVKIGLSAGRVQSVAVKLIVEREREINDFQPAATFKVGGQLLLAQRTPLEVELPKPLLDYQEAKEFLQKAQGATFNIEDIQQKESVRTPPPPFTTSTLQQTAFQTLGYSVKQTMTLAQKLYEAGFITYMRTDAVRLAPEAQAEAKAAILQDYGAAYYTARIHQTKSATAQEAHEAIRPVNFSKKVVSQDSKLQKLYQLIYIRAIASQMSSARIDKTIVTVGVSSLPQKLLAQGAFIKFAGYLAAYGPEEQTKEGALPLLKVGEALTMDRLYAKETFSKPRPRYTEASLVKKLEELGIGRPSTYAPIVSAIQQRGYVKKEDREGARRPYRMLTLESGGVQEVTLQETFGSEKSKLFPTSTAMVVNDFLNAYCREILDYSFTAHTEAALDKIAAKELDPQEMLRDFYSDFSQQVERATQAENQSKKERILGTDPKSGKPVIARFSKRYGSLLQLGSIEDDTKPRFASLPVGKLLDNVTLEEALKCFALPREVGTYEGAPITAHIGRYGPYLKHQDAFYSLGKNLDPLTVSQEEAMAVIEAKRQTAAGPVKTFAEDPGVEIRRGRYGTYIKTPNRNVSIPKGCSPDTLTYLEVKELVEKAPPKRKRKTASPDNP